MRRARPVTPRFARLPSWFDEIVFAEPGDLQRLGARTLEGLDLTIDPVRRRLVAAGPFPATGA